MKNKKKLSASELFEHLLNVISSERFLNKQGLANEIPFFICPYKVEDAVEMQRMQRQLKNKLVTQLSINVLEINLYDLSIEILKKHGDWEWYLKEEASMEKIELKDELQSILDIEQIIIPEMTLRMKESDFDVLFITGIGEVFPYIRSHNVLNNLQSKAKEKPTVLFFPGSYTHSVASGSSLNLFERILDDNYYRAFNIINFEV